MSIFATLCYSIVGTFLVLRLRALDERVEDLEAIVEDLENEKEQQA